jgi:hypothetical protein
MNAQLSKTIVAWLFILSSTSAISQIKPDVVQKKYDLARVHSQDTQYFIMESRLTRFNPNGTRMEPDIYRLYLRCVPGRSGADEYTCLKFTVKSGQSPETSVPALANWKYIFTRRSDEKDEKEQLFGIDHSRFEHLKDENGNSIFIDKSYHIYNAFIDFHSMNVFADKTPKGKGVQDLSHIGDTVVHYASWSEPPVNLGSKVEKGSVFKNGKVILDFKGLSLVNGRSCAVIEYDSGESSFTMLMKPTPDPKEEHPIGMNGQYKISNEPTFGLPMAVKGRWVNDTTLELNYNRLCRIEDFKSKIVFKSNSIELTITEPTKKINETLIGKVLER